MNEPRKSKKTPDIARATRKADEVLSRAGYIRPPVPIHDILLDYGLQVHVQALEANVSGFLVRKETGAFVGVNALHHRNRQRFTLAHELGHFLLHEDNPTVFVDDALIHFRGEAITQPSDAYEMEANAFAGALLMPEKMLQQDLSGRLIDAFDEGAVRTLARRYEVSPQALTLRLMRIGLLGGVAPPSGRSGR